MLDLEKLVLLKGSHSSREEGVCIMEAVAWAAGESHTDHPLCVCPVFGDALRAFNDLLADGERQDLKRYIFRIIGSAGDGFAERRAFMLLDWTLREQVPRLWDRLEMHNEAATLRAMAEINDFGSLKATILLLVSHRALDVARALALALAADLALALAADLDLARALALALAAARALDLHQAVALAFTLDHAVALAVAEAATEARKVFAQSHYVLLDRMSALSAGAVAQ